MLWCDFCWWALAGSNSWSACSGKPEIKWIKSILPCKDLIRFNVDFSRFSIAQRFIGLKIKIKKKRLQMTIKARNNIYSFVKWSMIYSMPRCRANGMPQPRSSRQRRAGMCHRCQHAVLQAALQLCKLCTEFIIKEEIDMFFFPLGFAHLLHRKKALYASLSFKWKQLNIWDKHTSHCRNKTGSDVVV